MTYFLMLLQLVVIGLALTLLPDNYTEGRTFAVILNLMTIGVGLAGLYFGIATLVARARHKATMRRLSEVVNFIKEK